jgi:hypothetical protein
MRPNSQSSTRLKAVNPREVVMLSVRWLMLLPVAAAFACSPPRLGPGEINNSQLITEDEIVASRATTAYEAIQKLRANFLTYRGETSLNKSRSTPYPTVYLDGQEFGPIGILRTIPASQVATIRLYRSWEATTKYGSRNMGGVIEVSTRQ